LVTLEPEVSEIFNREDAIVRHELGHAVVWYHYGGALGRLRFYRMPDRLLMGGVLFRGRGAEVSQEDYMRTLTVRLLAGEVAARRFLRLPPDRIACEFPLTSYSNIDRLRPLIQQSPTDIMRAIDAAYHVASLEWWQWLLERHSEATEIVDAAWPVIESSAKVLEPYVPLEPNSEWQLPGLNLIEMFERGGVSSRIRPPVELVHDAVRGSLATRARRFWRSRISRSLITATIPPMA
jgi:hypothetical protein